MTVVVFDTNVVSELMKGSAGDEQVRAWVRSVSRAERHTTAITVAEVLLGVALIPDGARKTELYTAAAEAFASFGERVIAFDGHAAQQYAAVVATRTAVGAPIKELDAQIAAICLTHSCTLATRNVKDFVGIGLPLINPWASTS